MELLTAGVLVLGLAMVHLFVGSLHFLDVVPRSRWLSFAGGASVAYVFVHLLPDLAEAHETIQEADWAIVRELDQHVYLIALIGLTLFYALEYTARGARRRGGTVEHEASIFWLHLGAFSLYSALIGYLMTNRPSEGETGELLFGAAMALHFLTVDFGLRLDYASTYDHFGRWVLVAALLTGALTGALVDITEAFVAVLLAVLAGAVILNTLKEELPDERQSRLSAFLIGVITYGGLLLLL